MKADATVELGEQVQDKLTDFEGTVTCVSHHITGCTRIGVRDTVSDGTSRGDEEYFYDAQLDSQDELHQFGHDPTTECDIDVGEKVKDTVTGFEGVVSILAFELFNCPRACIQPIDGTDSTEMSDSEWVDVPRLESVGDGVTDDVSDLQQTSDVSATGASAEDFQRVEDPQ